MEKNLINIQFFGGLKDFFESTITIELPTESKISDCVHNLIKQQPHAKSMLQKCAIALNGIIHKENTMLHHNDQLVIMPPYSGG